MVIGDLLDKTVGF